MNCLCCGKPLPREEEPDGWHRRCVKRFFGTASLPLIDLSEDELALLAFQSASLGYTVPGVQKKLSLHLSAQKDHPRLTLINYPAGYILKPQVEEFKALPEAEHLCMSMAQAAGLSAVPHALIRCGGSIAYITRRVDRALEGNAVIKLAMEDFCQLDLHLTRDKYRGSYERCAGIIDRYSARKGLDISELYLRIVFSYLTGNSDMHLKNFSLIQTKEKPGEYVLSPAYDLLPVNIIMPEDTEQFALAMNGKKTNLRRKDFLIFAGECGIAKNAAEKMIGKMLSMRQRFELMCRESQMPEDMKESLIRLIGQRTRSLAS